MAQEPKYPVQTVMKALELLNHLAKNTGNLGAGDSELSDALGIGKSTVHRLLDTLQYYGYIEKSEETNRYRLGWELYKVGLSVPAQNQLFNIDRTHLLELGKKLNETIDYGTIKGKETIIISKMAVHIVCNIYKLSSRSSHRLPKRHSRSTPTPDKNLTLFSKGLEKIFFCKACV